MADNILVKPSADVTAVPVALDDVGGVKYQVVKLARGADGVATLIDATGGLPVALDTASLAALEQITVTVANPISGFSTEATLAAILTELGQKLEPGQQVALDATTLAALESITVVDGGGSLTVDGTVGISGTVPVSAAALPLPPGAAQDGTDISSPTAMPAGGAGIRGWLSAIWTKLNGSLAITAAALPLPSGAAQEHATAASPASARLSDGTTYIGSTAQRLHVDDGGSTLSVDDGGGSVTVDGAVSLAAAIPAGTNAIGTVDLSAATPTAIADGATASATKYIGITVSETTNAATAKVRVRNGNATGTILDTITLVANESVSYTYPRGRAAVSGTVYLQVVSGAVEGSVFTA
jgi:hypothetical protein